jgi:hypothetical protein
MPNKAYTHKIGDNYWYGYYYNKGYEEAVGASSDRAQIKVLLHNRGFSVVVSDGNLWHPDIPWVLSPTPRPRVNPTGKPTPRRSGINRTNGNIRGKKFPVQIPRGSVVADNYPAVNIPEHKEISRVPAATRKARPSYPFDITYLCGHSREGFAYDVQDAAEIENLTREQDCPSCIIKRIDEEERERKAELAAATYSDKWRDD